MPHKDGGWAEHQEYTAIATAAAGTGLGCLGLAGSTGEKHPPSTAAAAQLSQPLQV